jgi:hypothetical protein
VSVDTLSAPLEGVALPEGLAASIDVDADLGAVWDKMERDNGAERDNGRFASPDKDEPEPEQESAGPPPPADGEEEAQSVSTPVAAAPLPPNLLGLEEDLAKIPADIREKIAARAMETHARMSDQGRQISTFKPITEVLERHKDVISGHRMPDGSPVTPHTAIDFLFNAQRKLDANPVAGLLEIIDTYNARDALKAVLTGQQEIPRTPQPAPKPVDVERLVEAKLNEFTLAQKGQEEISRLSQGKPLFSEIPEDEMVFHINKAWEKLGSTASRQAVFDLAYDRAVNADPVLRAKAVPPKAVPPKAPDIEAVKRANSVNIPSTSSGKPRPMSEDELLAATYDKAQGH